MRISDILKTMFLLSLTLIGFMLVLTSRVDGTSKTVTVGSKSWIYSPYDRENFTIIVLPDTQYYSESYLEIFNSQTQWIVDNKERMNIVFVTHLGDVVDHFSIQQEWHNANSSMSALDDEVPWGILPGNHDLGGVTSYSKYFGYERFNSESWYGGAYQDVNTNNYQLFSAGGDDYLIFHLQYEPNNETLAWATDIIGMYPDRRVNVSTHDYMMGLFSWRSNVGERMWTRLVRPNADQIFLVLCGHVWEEARRTDIVNDDIVHQLLSDYQSRSNGGNGWLRILEFSPLDDKIHVRTYSPYLNRFENDSNSQFTLDYDMTAIPANITVTSNSTLSDFSYNRLQKQLSFSISSETGTIGYCNVSIPRTLLEGNPWTVKINDEIASYVSNQNATHSLLHFSYTHTSTLQVDIEGTWAIPEYAFWHILPLFMIGTSIASMIFRRKLKNRRS